MRPGEWLCQMGDGKGALTVSGIYCKVPVIMGSSVSFAHEDGGYDFSVAVAEGGTEVMAVLVENPMAGQDGYKSTPKRAAFLLKIGWKDDKLRFDEDWGFISSPDRLASISPQGISIRCGENHQDLYYAPNPVRCLARNPKPGEKVISCDDACLFLGEKITKDQLDDRIRQRIAQEDRMAELQQRLETAESQRQDEVAARHEDRRKFELEMAALILKKDGEKAKYGEQLTKQLRDNFDRTPVWRLIGQRINAWRKDCWRWLKSGF